MENETLRLIVGVMFGSVLMFLAMWPVIKKNHITGALSMGLIALAFYALAIGMKKISAQFPCTKIVVSSEESSTKGESEKGVDWKTKCATDPSFYSANQEACSQLNTPRPPNYRFSSQEDLTK